MILRSKPQYLMAFLVLLALVALLALGGCRLFQETSGFDPRYLATTEVRMWQAYYGKSKVKLAWLLVRVLHREFDISYWEAVWTGKLLASAAMKFKTAKPGHYDTALPDLVAAYTRLKKCSGKTYDPAEAARAELAWWVARRTPGKNDPETVGKGIGHLYEVIYGYHHPELVRAGLLRAEAAHVRDQGGKNCDWKKVEELLLESYRALQIGMENRPEHSPDARNGTAAEAD